MHVQWAWCKRITHTLTQSTDVGEKCVNFVVVVFVLKFIVQTKHRRIFLTNKNGSSFAFCTGYAHGESVAMHTHQLPNIEWVPFAREHDPQLFFYSFIDGHPVISALKSVSSQLFFPHIFPQISSLWKSFAKNNFFNEKWSGTDCMENGYCFRKIWMWWPNFLSRIHTHTHMQRAKGKPNERNKCSKFQFNEFHLLKIDANSAMIFDCSIGLIRIGWNLDICINLDTTLQVCWRFKPVWWANATIFMGKRSNRAVIMCPDRTFVNCAFATMAIRRDAKRCSAHRRRHANPFKLATRAVNSFAWMMH